jgi:hypothetical protein
LSRARKDPKTFDKPLALIMTSVDIRPPRER